MSVPGDALVGAADTSEASGVQLGPDDQRRMLQALRRQWSAGSSTGIALIETHISFVLVGAERAYKFKKVLKTAFLDQSTLARRRRACSEELRLNGRWAEGLYLGVVEIGGPIDAPRWLDPQDVHGAGGPSDHEAPTPRDAVIDCAVTMRAFDQAGLWDRLAAGGGLRPSHIDDLAAVLASIHARAAVADPQGRLGTPDQVRRALVDNLDELDRLPGLSTHHHELQQLRTWEAATFERLAPFMAERLQQGRVRECHGDLHLGNVTVVDDRVTVFDGIEFNDDFRWIDVVGDLAFMAMDLRAHGLPALAHRLVNAYLEHSGDYGGVRLLRYHMVHRSLVRAKVAQLRAAQLPAHTPEAVLHAASTSRYLELAVGLGRPTRPVLMLTHGFSGSGKTTLTQGLLEACGAVRIRADVERKRAAGLEALARAPAAQGPVLDAGLYSPQMTAMTYTRLLQLAGPVLAEGHHAILDATYLRRDQRDEARHWAEARGVPCLVLDVDADVQTLRQRLRQRASLGTDASDADEVVLAAQMRSAEPLQPDERVFVCRQGPASEASAAGGPPQADWSALLHRLHEGSLDEGSGPRV